MNRRLAILLPCLLLGLLLTALTACSGLGGSSDSTETSGDAATTSEEATAAGDDGAGADTQMQDRPALESAPEAAGGKNAATTTAEQVPAGRREVVSTGNVALRSEDVGRTRLEVRKVVARFDGEISQEETSNNGDADGADAGAGQVDWSYLTLRIPTADFDAALQDLGDLDELVSLDRSTEDVTGEVVDTEVRVRNQRRSIDRIRQLLARAEDIGAIVAIESQLAQREADLASLEARQASLADRTSMSTITVSIERAGGEQQEEETDDAGFVSGLQAGWDALSGFGVALATVAGALLPWLVLLLVLAVPGVPLARRLRRTTRRTGAAPTTS